VRIICGDSADVLSRLPARSVHLCVTSPPYDDLRTYGGYSWNFERTASELHRVLCDGGVVCWNVNDSVVDRSETLTSCDQKIFFRRTLGFRIHDTMIYEKLNFSHPERVRYHQTFEYVFVLSKGAPRCFNPIKDKANASAGDPGSFGRNTYAMRDGSRRERKRQVIARFGMRTNVWRGKTRGQEEFGRKLPRPGMMPRWLARDLILSWSNEGDTVIDPMSGSGTTGIEAARLNRSAILIDQSSAATHIAGAAVSRFAEASA
jgi:site-specific DNA-methyltransferase (adenine-specific)